MSWPVVTTPVEDERINMNGDGQLPDIPQNEDMEPVEDEQKHRLHNNDNAETEALALQDERENDELPLPENIQLHELQRRYPTRRRTQRQRADFVNWDDLPPQLLHN